MAFEVEKLKAKLARLSKRHESGCLLFTGSLDRDGYGIICVQYRQTRVHRVAAWLYSLIPSLEDKKLVLHSKECQFRHCIEESHLRAGTQTDNMQDRPANPRRDYNISYHQANIEDERRRKRIQQRARRRSGQ